jgi:hypothetical protein
VAVDPPVSDAPGAPDPARYVPFQAPFVDEAFPATGRRSGLLDQQRRDNGNLPDADPGDPVVDNNPFRPKGGR